jgi:flagellar biosynthesis protein
VKDKGHEDSESLHPGPSSDDSESRGQVADKIIALARRHGVPVHGDRHLIEILSTMDLSEEIPSDMYKAIAEMLVFVHRTSGKM